MSYIRSIDLRRVWIADEETGLAFGLTMFRHPMDERFVTLLNPDGTKTQRPMNFNLFDLEAAHIFKIRGGQIHEIEAMGFSRDELAMLASAARRRATVRTVRIWVTSSYGQPTGSTVGTAGGGSAASRCADAGTS